MARYKDYNYAQSKLLPINFSEQILPGSFEYTVNYLVDIIDFMGVHNNSVHNNFTAQESFYR